MLEVRTRYIARLIRLYRRLANKHAIRVTSATTKQADDVVGKILDKAHSSASRISSMTGFLKTGRGAHIENQKKAAVELAVERLDKAFKLGKAEAAIVLADLYLVSPMPTACGGRDVSDNYALLEVGRPFTAC